MIQAYFLKASHDSQISFSLRESNWHPILTFGHQLMDPAPVFEDACPNCDQCVVSVTLNDVAWLLPAPVLIGGVTTQRLHPPKVACPHCLESFLGRCHNPETASSQSRCKEGFWVLYYIIIDKVCSVPKRKLDGLRLLALLN